MVVCLKSLFFWFRFFTKHYHDRDESSPLVAMLSGITLSSSAAAWHTHTTVIHHLNVSNDTAGLVFDPPYILRQ